MSFSMLILAFALSLFLNLCVIFCSQKFHFFIDSDTSDKPQRFHTTPVPRAGGLSIFIPFVIFISLNLFENPSPLLLGLLCGGGIVFLSGIIEDFNGSLSPKLRLLLQCLGGWLFVWLSGEVLSDLGFGISLPSFIAIPFSVFAIVGIINAINIIDGFNGLASGVVLLALSCIAFLIPSDLAYAPLIYILMACIFGFWILNFPFGKIFLGDGGAYFLGFVLASVLIVLTQNTLRGGSISPWFGIALLIYPFWEVMFSIYRRVGRSSPLLADNRHFHQYLYQFLKSKIPHANPLTSLVILMLIAPFMASTILFYHNHLALALLALGFILMYLILYRILSQAPSPRGLV